MSMPIGPKTEHAEMTRGPGPAKPANFAAARGGVSGADTPKDDPKKVHSAAQSFESLMIAQMLKSIRESSDSSLGSDSAGTSAMELAEEELAKSLSQSGGFGLAKMVEAGLTTAPASHARPAAQKLIE